jgi:hypothetical protein
MRYSLNRQDTGMMMITKIQVAAFDYLVLNKKSERVIMCSQTTGEWEIMN